MHGMHAATSKVENSTQGSSCKLKFVNSSINYDQETLTESGRISTIDLLIKICCFVKKDKCSFSMKKQLIGITPKKGF